MKILRLSIYLTVVIAMYVAFRVYQFDPPPLPSLHTMVHRGGGFGQPENTIETMENIWAMGFAPEIDLRLTKDFKVVCFHDHELTRVVHKLPKKYRKLSIADLTYDELKKLDVGTKFGKRFAGQRIALVDDVFKRMKGHPDRFVYLDIKRVYLDQLEEMVRNYGLTNQVIITTSDYKILRRWKIQVPESKTMLWTRGNDAWLTNTMAEIRKHGFFGLTHFQINITVTKTGEEPFTVSRRMIRKMGKELRRYGIVLQAFPASVSDQSVYRQLADLGVMSFGTDYPADVMQFLDHKNDPVQLPSVTSDASMSYPEDLRPDAGMVSH